MQLTPKVLIWRPTSFNNIENYNTLLKNGLVAYYPFNGNANDVSGNNLNGEIINAILTSNRNNNGNSAYYFNGQSSIEISNNSKLNTSGVTYSVWYNSEIKNSTILVKNNQNNTLEFAFNLPHIDEFQGQIGLLYSCGVGNYNSYTGA